MHIYSGAIYSTRNGNAPMPTAPGPRANIVCVGGFRAGGCRAKRDGGWVLSPEALAKDGLSPEALAKGDTNNELRVTSN